MIFGRFRPDRSGRFRPGLRRDEVELIRALPGQARELLDRRDPSTVRLFPTAYLNDPEAEAEYRTLMEGDLIEAHRLALDTMAKTADADAIDLEELHRWLEGLEILRLVLGTQLDVSEDPDEMAADDPDRAGPLSLYRYLSFLQEQAVEALSSTLPDPGPDGGPELPDDGDLDPGFGDGPDLGFDP